MDKDFREISDEGREAIQAEEGTILFAYDDAVFPTRPVRVGEAVKGTLTIGTGHTGPDVAIGMEISEDDADRLLDRDLDIVERAIARLVKVELNDNQHAVLCSFAFNAGVGALEDSTLLRKLNAGDYAGAGLELLKWTKTTKTINGKKVKVESAGLKARRARELALWNSAPGTTITTTYRDITDSTGKAIEGPVAEPRATEVAEPPKGGLSGMLASIFDIFKPKQIDPITNKPVKTQPISEPFKSKINWTAIMTVVFSVAALFGLDIPAEQRAQIVTIITTVGGLLTWFLSTFRRQS